MKQIHRCPECSHSHEQHEHSYGYCMFGYCACTQTQDEVRAAGVVDTIPTFPGFDPATGKWAVR